MTLHLLLLKQRLAALAHYKSISIRTDTPDILNQALASPLVINSCQVAHKQSQNLHRVLLVVAPAWHWLHSQKVQTHLHSMG